MSDGSSTMEIMENNLFRRCDIFCYVMRYALHELLVTLGYTTHLFQNTEPVLIKHLEMLNIDGVGLNIVSVK